MKFIKKEIGLSKEIKVSLDLGLKDWNSTFKDKKICKTNLLNNINKIEKIKVMDRIKSYNFEFNIIWLNESEELQELGDFIILDEENIYVLESYNDLIETIYSKTMKDKIYTMIYSTVGEYNI